MATDYIKALNAGTGLNTTEIIDGLMAAQREPAADKITKAREEKTVSISGLGVLKQTLNIAQTGLTSLEGITGLTLGNSGTAMEMTIADTSVAKAFSHKVEVSQLATSHTLVFQVLPARHRRWVPAALPLNLAAGRTIPSPPTVTAAARPSPLPTAPTAFPNYAMRSTHRICRSPPRSSKPVKAISH